MENDVKETIEQKETEKSEVKEIEKIKELEELYNKKLEDLTAKEKELEPLLNLQQFLYQNPDKAQKIAKILQSEESEEESEDLFTIGNDDDKIKKLEKELSEVKNELSQYKSDIILSKDIQDIKEKINEYAKMYGEDFDIDKYMARMLSFPENYLDSLSDMEFTKLSDQIAKSVSELKKQEKERLIKRYIEAKKEVATKTKSESKPSTIGKTEKEIKVSLEDGSAKKLATELLKKYVT